MTRRKKSSPLEDVLDLLAMLPWWACLVLGAASYFLLHHLAVPIRVSDLQGQGGAMVGAVMQTAMVRGLANVGQYIVPLLCLAAAAISAWRRRQRQALISEVAHTRNADLLDGMSWREFELLVGEAYRLQGYRVAEIGGGGPDGGVDLVLTKGAEKFLVQCKQWKAFKVGVSTVRELYGVMAAKGATGGFVVTSGRFTPDAKDFAQGRNVELVDGHQLFALIQKARSNTRAEPASSSMKQAAFQPGNVATGPLATSSGAGQPECPRCGAAMALRTAKQGAK